MLLALSKHMFLSQVSHEEFCVLVRASRIRIDTLQQFHYVVQYNLSSPLFREVPAGGVISAEAQHDARDTLPTSSRDNGKETVNTRH